MASDADVRTRDLCSLDDLLCKGCNKKAKSGPQCGECGGRYHPSCADRCRKCCGAPLGNVCVTADHAGASAILDFLSGPIFEGIVANIVRVETYELHGKIAKLQEEVANLRSSNIEMVRLLTRTPVASSLPVSATGVDVNLNTAAESSETAKNVYESNQNHAVKIPNTDQDSKNTVGPTFASMVSGNIATDTNVGRNAATMDHAVVQTHAAEGSVADWQTVSKRPRTNNRRRVIVGTCDNSQLAAVEKKHHIYLGRMAPATTATAVKEHIVTSLGISATCEILNQGASYSSFKIGVDMSVKPKILDPAIWPKHAIIREFFQSNRRNTTAKNPDVAKVNQNFPPPVPLTTHS